MEPSPQNPPAVPRASGGKCRSRGAVPSAGARVGVIPTLPWAARAGAPSVPAPAKPLLEDFSPTPPCSSLRNVFDHLCSKPGVGCGAQSVPCLVSLHKAVSAACFNQDELFLCVLWLGVGLVCFYFLADFPKSPRRVST